MGLFRLFHEKKYVRLIFLFCLGFIVVTLRFCDTNAAYGFPTVYLVTSYESSYSLLDSSKTVALNRMGNDLIVFNILLNALFMGLTFLVIEKVRASNMLKDTIIIFDKALFFVIIYLLIAFILDTAAVNFPEQVFWIYALPLYLSFPIYLLGVLVMNITNDWFLNHVPFGDTLYPMPEDYMYRLSLITFSILMFFIVYYILKFYYRRKENKSL